MGPANTPVPAHSAGCRLVPALRRFAPPGGPFLPPLRATRLRAPGPMPILRRIAPPGGPLLPPLRATRLRAPGPMPILRRIAPPRRSLLPPLRATHPLTANH